MKKFKSFKNMEQIAKDATTCGWVVDRQDWDENLGDWFYLTDYSKRMLMVAINCFGRFYVYTPLTDKPIATEESSDYDNESWYTELLDLIYECA